MTKVTMPEPVAAVIEGIIRQRRGTDLEEGETLITTTQAEAYAAAKVREALEEAAALCDRFAERGMHPSECAGAIRTLIPKEPT